MHYNATSAACARTALHAKQSKLSNLGGSNKQQHIQPVHQIEQLCKSANITVLYRRTRLTGTRLLTGQQLNKRVHGYPDHPFHPLLCYRKKVSSYSKARTVLGMLCRDKSIIALIIGQYMKYRPGKRPRGTSVFYSFYISYIDLFNRAIIDTYNIYVSSAL